LWSGDWEFGLRKDWVLNCRMGWMCTAWVLQLMKPWWVVEKMSMSSSGIAEVIVVVCTGSNGMNLQWYCIVNCEWIAGWILMDELVIWIACRSFLKSRRRWEAAGWVDHGLEMWFAAGKEWVWNGYVRYCKVKLSNKNSQTNNHQTK
jgi:hypothetical protein